MEFPAPSAADLEVVTGQLGRAPTGVVGIAARCPAGHPSVVQSYPLQRRGGRLHPFPTLFWLTCPELVRAVSRLEMNGLIATLDRRLAADPALAADLRADHRAYIELRWRLLTDADRAAVADAGLAEVFQRRGIGGLAHLGSVKCLHLHYAHHLATANVIGALLAADHGVCPCGG